MARASTRTLTPAVEQCWTLVGTRRGGIWLARRIDRRAGQRSSVHFEGPSVLAREEQRGDVLGFLPTHPDGPPLPSRRDVRTMRAWCSAFGKPLLCVIASPEGLAGFRFDDDTSAGLLLARIELFPRGVVIGVETDERQVPS